MNLLRPTNLSIKLVHAYDFLLSSQFSSIIVNPFTLGDTLDEYIYYMNMNYGMYDNRIKNERSLGSDKYCEHLANFKKISQGYSINFNEKELIVNFYEKLLKYIDNLIGQEYYLGKKFNINELALIDKTNMDDSIYQCSISSIIFYVPRKIFEIKKFIKLSKEYSYTNLMPQIKKEKIYYKIYFNNTNCNFYFCHIENIKSSCINTPSFKISYNLSNDDELVIVFY